MKSMLKKIEEFEIDELIEIVDLINERMVLSRKPSGLDSGVDITYKEEIPYNLPVEKQLLLRFLEKEINERLSKGDK